FLIFKWRCVHHNCGTLDFWGRLKLTIRLSVRSRNHSEPKKLFANRSQEIAESLEPRLSGNGTEIRIEPSGLYVIKVTGNITKVKKLISWLITPKLSQLSPQSF